MTPEPIGDIRDAQGRELVDGRGRPLGHIRGIFLDETTREPAWATVDAPGGEDQLVLVPLAHATVEGERVRVVALSETVTSSPATTGSSERFEPDHMDRVRRHYADEPAGHVEDLTGPPTGPPTADAGRAADVGTDMPPSVVRSEEELVIGRERVAHERVRLVKRVVTETVTQTYEVRREELHVERLPLGSMRDATDSAATSAGDPGVVTDASRAATAPASPGGLRSRVASLRLPPAVDGLLSRFGRSRLGSGGSAFGEDFADEFVDITLLEERVVVTKRVVPRERVRIHREVVVEQRTVSDALRKERVEVERSALEPGAAD